MQHLSPWRALLLVTVLCQPGISDKYGCLFERKLCERDQFCSDDGLFGQCLSSKQDQVRYQVSVPVLKRMQEVLKQLMLQGLSWQDDITQYILSKELKRVPHTTHPSKPNSSSSSSHPPQSKQHVPLHLSSKAASTPAAGNYVDYMIVEPPQSQLRMQTASMDPYTYHQHRYQDEVERSLLGAGYARPPSRSQAIQRERGRERDRQLLQEALSFYLASAQPSYRHRGAASMAPAGLPYYEDLEVDIPMDYVEGYTLEERLGPTRQQMLQKEKVAQDFSTLSENNDGLLQRMSGVLQRYGVDPRELSQEQLYKLALILQLLQAQDKTDPVGKDVIALKEAPPAPSSASVPATSPAKIAGHPSPATQPPQAAPEEAGQGLKEQGLPLVEGVGAKEEYGYIVTDQRPLSLYDGVKLLELLADKIHLTTSSFINIRASGQNKWRTDARGRPQVSRVPQGSSGTVITLVSMAVVGGVLVLAMAVACLRHYAQQVANGKLGLGPEGGAETHFDYQELCRQHMASKSSLCRQDCVGGVSGSMAGSAIGTGAGGRRGTDTSRVSSVSSQFSDGPQHSPSSTHSSTPSWSEEPAQSNMDISTGHMILAYMEDHLRNKDRLQKEWEALCSYQAEPSSVAVAQVPSNMEKNRHAESLPYDHTRVKLKTEVNPNKQDYINASIIFDHDPRQPAYIATQGPLPHTVADFWQVNLVSEHIWCKDFLVRSFYLKNVQTQETRTLTQFHLLSWPADGIPTSTRPLLDFRRKVNKCYRGRSCPIIVHCSDGTSRTGTYILIDMVLNRMAKGVKEIDIAATLEHIRDQRPGLVRTKDQFEFALTAVAEEVNAILKALPQ
ncbi:hypothetical protein INR49_005267 [Caranx melampygus]|nr:hypothetical protein INR49_005267 [Caranx melampygus]